MWQSWRCWVTCVEYLLHSVVGSGEIIRGKTYQMVCSCLSYVRFFKCRCIGHDRYLWTTWVRAIACILHYSPLHFWLKSGQSCPKKITNYNTYGPRLSCEAMPEQVAMEPIAWLKSADYRGYAGYEQQMALKAHLDSLAVELSLLRSDVVDVLHQRNLRRRRDDIFRLWHSQVAYDKLKQSLEVSSPPSQNVNVKRARAGVSDRDLRNENTLRCATLLCFFYQVHCCNRSSAIGAWWCTETRGSLWIWEPFQPGACSSFYGLGVQQWKWKAPPTGACRCGGGWMRKPCFKPLKQCFNHASASPWSSPRMWYNFYISKLPMLCAPCVTMTWPTSFCKPGMARWFLPPWPRLVRPVPGLPSTSQVPPDQRAFGLDA